MDAVGAGRERFPVDAGHRLTVKGSCTGNSAVHRTTGTGDTARGTVGASGREAVVATVTPARTRQNEEVHSRRTAFLAGVATGYGLLDVVVQPVGHDGWTATAALPRAAIVGVAKANASRDGVLSC